MDGSDLNSSARGSRMEDDASGMGDATRMGGESGESSGSSDDDDDNRNEDQGFEHATIKPTAGLDSPRTGGQAHRLPGWSTATSSNSRHHTSTHMTPISRPRNQQRERLPEGPGNRVGNVMAMMMMSQAQDRDKRQEEREERHQKFHIQVKMQHQQMQNQQNMMDMIMMSMMGRNASGSVPDEGIVNMLAGRSSDSEQHNNGQGGNNNTQE